RATRVWLAAFVVLFVVSLVAAPVIIVVVVNEARMLVGEQRLQDAPLAVVAFLDLREIIERPWWDCHASPRGTTSQTRPRGNGPRRLTIVTTSARARVASPPCSFRST